MKPYYMEALVSQLGIRRVIYDLREVVEQIARNCVDTDKAAKYWWLEQDLSQAIEDFTEED